MEVYGISQIFFLKKQSLYYKGIYSVIPHEDCMVCCSTIAVVRAGAGAKHIWKTPGVPFHGWRSFHFLFVYAHEFKEMLIWQLSIQFQWWLKHTDNHNDNSLIISKPILVLFADAYYALCHTVYRPAKMPFL